MEWGHEGGASSCILGPRVEAFQGANARKATAKFGTDFNGHSGELAETFFKIY